MNQDGNYRYHHHHRHHNLITIRGSLPLLLPPPPLPSCLSWPSCCALQQIDDQTFDTIYLLEKTHCSQSPLAHLM